MSSNITYYDQETNTYFVAGTHASQYEYYVALALDKLKIDYTFQYSPWGFTGVRGQYIVDFLLYNPMPLPVEVFGEHWHLGCWGRTTSFGWRRLSSTSIRWLKSSGGGSATPMTRRLPPAGRSSHDGRD